MPESLERGLVAILLAAAAGFLLGIAPFAVADYGYAIRVSVWWLPLCTAISAWQLSVLLGEWRPFFAFMLTAFVPPVVVVGLAFVGMSRGISMLSSESGFYLVPCVLPFVAGACLGFRFSFRLWKKAFQQAHSRSLRLRRH